MSVRAWRHQNLLLLGGGLLLFVVFVWSLSLGLDSDVLLITCASLRQNLKEERNSTSDEHLITNGSFIAKETVPLVIDVEEEYADLGRPGIPRSYGFSRLGKLTGKDILLKDMKKVDLSYFQGIRCEGPPCPNVARCTSGLPATATRIGACSNEFAIDPEVITSPPPLNIRAEDLQHLPLIRPFDGKEKHFLSSIGQFSGQVIVLENVFINEDGVVFDENHIYDHRPGRCGSPFDTYKYEANNTCVHHYEEMSCVINSHGGNFYHDLMETMPALLLLKPFLELRPGMPIAFSELQEAFLHLYALIDLKSTILNARIISPNKLFFTKRLLLPIMAPCIRPSAALIQHIRAKYLFKNTPQLSPQKEVTTQKKGVLVGSKGLSSTRSDAMGPPMESGRKGGGGGLELIPEDWVVVIGQRARDRQIEGQDELFAKLTKILPRNRTEVFYGDLSLEETQALLKRARLFISPHGALLANIIFMPSYGEVIEVRPVGYGPDVYHLMTHICGLRYYLLWGNGTWDTHITIDHDEIINIVRNIVKTLPPSET